MHNMKYCKCEFNEISILYIFILFVKLCHTIHHENAANPKVICMNYRHT